MRMDRFFAAIISIAQFLVILGMVYYWVCTIEASHNHRESKVPLRYYYALYQIMSIITVII